MRKFPLVMFLIFNKGVKRVGGDVDTYWELLGDFIQELPEKLNAMENYFTVKDMDGALPGST